MQPKGFFQGQKALIEAFDFLKKGLLLILARKKLNYGITGSSCLQPDTFSW